MKNSGKKGGRKQKSRKCIFQNPLFGKEQGMFNKPVIRQKEPL